MFKEYRHRYGSTYAYQVKEEDTIFSDGKVFVVTTADLDEVPFDSDIYPDAGGYIVNNRNGSLYYCSQDKFESRHITN